MIEQEPLLESLRQDPFHGGLIKTVCGQPK